MGKVTCNDKENEVVKEESGESCGLSFHFKESSDDQNVNITIKQ